MNIKSLYLICITMAFMGAVTGSALAESQFENGFRGVAWGTHKDQLPDLGLSKGALNNIYKTGPSSAIFMAGTGTLAMEMDGIPLLSIFFNFHDQIFYSADLVFNPEYKKRIHRIIAAEMGSDGMDNDAGTLWKTQTLSILLTDHELLIKSERFNPDKPPKDSPPGTPAQDIPCCPAKT